ncbi:hypothetical protein N7463_007129 [Penicillium fimorum]|uniref:Uncharacterized protein n=1 Tax=Penicillium fimorum TaxID=1882269 RepID=A0A9W9XXA7_9EURO|nr:hypothetical protein N7463_007129 [Penicillium fimorum]
MITTPQQILNIDDALVSEVNASRLNCALDYELCARLHNYLVAFGWMARYGQETPNLDELATDEDIQAVRKRLHPSVNPFLDSIFSPGPSFFYWVNDITMELVDEIFQDEDNNLNDMTNSCTTPSAAFPMTLANLDRVQPIDDYEDMWFPFETVLTNWIHMLRISKITADSPEGKAPEELASSRSQIGILSWFSYCSSQVDSTRCADFTDVEPDGGSIPEECVIRSVLTREKSPCFKAIAPSLEVPHNTIAFTARHRLIGVPHNQEGWGKNIPPVLLFTAADSGRTVNFGRRFNAFSLGQKMRYHSMRIILFLWAEAGFCLLLPFRDHNGVKMSDGASIPPGSVTRLFQHGIFIHLVVKGELKDWRG